MAFYFDVFYSAIKDDKYIGEWMENSVSNYAK